MAAKRKYPVGIQSFESIRNDGYVYVDKTQLVYKMITEGKPYFLSRPRRFGKSLLVSTLAAVFEGRRELFEAFTTEDGIEQPQLFIATTDWRWEKFPVLRFDFSRSNLTTLEKLDNYINSTLQAFEKQYDIVQVDKDVSLRMVNIIHTAERQTGRKVVVLVDEYDNMMLHSLGDADQTKAVRERFQDLFAPLKSEDEHLRFVFVTGISKFSQMGVFSKLNQLNNISMDTAYESICGISEEELTTVLRTDIEMVAQKRGLTYEDMFVELKMNYDGYHFSEDLTDMFNPFSLFKVFNSGKLDSYWFSSATPGALIDMLSHMPPIDLTDIDGRECDSSEFDKPFDSYQSPLPVLYQSGYLTIKDYDRELDAFTLGLPNREVRKGFADCLYQYIAHKQDADDRERSDLQRAYRRFRRDDVLEPFIQALQVFFASVPYHFDNRNEHHYHSLLYTLLMAFGADVRAEEPTAKGRADLVLLMPKGIYVMELKYDGSAEEALEQIERKGYAEKYALDGRPVTKVGIAFSSEERNITEWKSKTV